MKQNQKTIKHGIVELASMQWLKMGIDLGRGGFKKNLKHCPISLKFGLKL